MEDVGLPKATVEKIVKDSLPKDLNIRLGAPTLDMLMECCNEFVQLVATEANTVSEEGKKKTINPEHVVSALERLGLAPFVDDVNAMWSEVKESEQSRNQKRQASKAEKKSTMSEEEQIALQKKLFAEARAGAVAPPEA